MKKVVTLLAGQRVHLKANKKEGWPRESAKVLEDTTIRKDEDLSRFNLCVEVKPDDEDDDGIREVTADQIEEIR